jgi:hypothetical protein
MARERRQWIKMMVSRIPFELETEKAMVMSVSFIVASNDMVIDASCHHPRHVIAAYWVPKFGKTKHADQHIHIHDYVDFVQAQSLL